MGGLESFSGKPNVTEQEPGDDKLMSEDSEVAELSGTEKIAEGEEVEDLVDEIEQVTDEMFELATDTGELIVAVLASVDENNQYTLSFSGQLIDADELVASIQAGNAGTVADSRIQQADTRMKSVLEQARLDEIIRARKEESVMESEPVAEDLPEIAEDSDGSVVEQEAELSSEAPEVPKEEDSSGSLPEAEATDEQIDEKMEEAQQVTEYLNNNLEEVNDISEVWPVLEASMQMGTDLWHEDKNEAVDVSRLKYDVSQLREAAGRGGGRSRVYLSLSDRTQDKIISLVRKEKGLP